MRKTVLILVLGFLCGSLLAEEFILIAVRCNLPPLKRQVVDAALANVGLSESVTNWPVYTRSPGTNEWYAANFNTRHHPKADAAWVSSVDSIAWSSRLLIKQLSMTNDPSLQLRKWGLYPKRKH
jgi:hypothetical protein